VKQTLNLPLAWWFVAICVLVVTGCDKASSRFAIEGTVTLDGQPLSEGGIVFLPQQGTKGPMSGGEISNGKFFVSTDKGAFAGKFRVEVTASHKVGHKEKDPLGNLVDEYEQYLPECYNRQSRLTAEITPSGPNHFEFTLNSR